MRRLALLWFGLHAPSGAAAEADWQRASIHYVAHDSQLADVLKDVVSAGGLQLDVARNIKGTVNGTFDESPARVFATLIEAYGLAWYFDGKTIHVSSAADVRSRTIPFAPMTREAVAALLHSLELDDSHLSIRYSDTTAKVSGPSRFVEAVADAIGNAQRQTVVDPAVDQIEIRVFPLRYAQAQDITYRSGNRDQVVSGVASLLRKLIGDTAVAAPGQPVKPRNEVRPGRGGPPPLPSLRGLGLADSGLPVEPLPLPASDPAQFAVPSVRRNIVADPRSNSVVIYDVPSMMPNYERAIAMLDQPQDLVEITAAVIDVTSDAAQELGIRWSGGISGRDGSAYAAMNGSPPGAAGLMPNVGGAMSGLNLATLIGNSANFLFARIHALEGSGKARILSQPQVLTLNNAEAVLTSHKSMYVRVAGNQDVDLYNVDTGLTLKVTPTVEPDGPRNILLSVQIEDGAFDTGATVDGIPKVSNHSIITQAVVGDGESLLIGGYEYEHSESSTSKVPMLGDIPYVGALFSSKQTSLEHLERLILITPRVKRMNATAKLPAPAGPATTPMTAVGRPGPGTVPSLPLAASATDVTRALQQAGAAPQRLGAANEVAR